MTAGAEAEVTKGEEVGAEVTIHTTDEAGVVAMNEGEVTAAIVMTGGEVTAASFRTEGEARYQDPDHIREVEQVVKNAVDLYEKPCCHLVAVVMPRPSLRRLCKHTTNITCAMSYGLLQMSDPPSVAARKIQA